MTSEEHYKTIVKSCINLLKLIPDDGSVQYRYAKNLIDEAQEIIRKNKFKQ